ncbi:fused isobutyryl-CoA mutase/GTPase IcmF [Sulfoacidibacillus thermotolerans]|uniref:Fused isobutyryl-CoA mutase n=1 Tax=Sulfoacidibacillus thermotolerans TaxID=1765684 RepID=A0A2U3DCD9_SULT2|nr:fused isobutyryl-CoA mutase/GTPase IcmF [Sulfoacidibacillus thermotolerans]PWI58951.1 methylmalonyl-CoA mutase [Sulfoacidibacillus thermotolerans]
METEVYRPQHRVRFVTASSLFDGHDASINIMRRLLQACGVEVIHLGHNRSVREIVETAIEEDVQGIAVSSYQGGHVEYFKYMVDMLKEQGSSHIRVFGGGGGVIVPREIEELHNYGVARIYSPDDGRKLGLVGMINDMVRLSDFPTPKERAKRWIESSAPLDGQDRKMVAELISLLEERVETGQSVADLMLRLTEAIGSNQKGQLDHKTVVVGITGTGGAGKSSLTDELVRRFIRDFPDKRIGILSIDPSKQKTGGALLGDRIRMNAIYQPQVYMRSMATRSSRSELSLAIEEAIAVLRAAAYDLVLVETSGIGQGDAAISNIADVSLYVMTSDFGAPSQLEKIDMLDYADLVAINKFDRKGSLDALAHVRKQLQRNFGRFSEPLENMPVYGTMASQFNDYGTNALYRALISTIDQKYRKDWSKGLGEEAISPERAVIIPGDRAHYLLDVVQTVRGYRAKVEEQVALASKWYQIEGTLAELKQRKVSETVLDAVLEARDDVKKMLRPENIQLIETFPELVQRYRQPEFITKVRDRELRSPLFVKSLAGLQIPKVAVPRLRDYGDILKYLLLENVPGEFPYTAGVFPLKRTEEEPKRQFAGEGTPERTNRRFHFLSKDDKAKRLSTAFDSVTLYGEDPDYRPDIYGKIGESGVSVCTLEDMEQLYDGFDLADPSTSVSMTINGPAPIILAMYLNTAINQQLKKYAAKKGAPLTDAEEAEVKEQTLRAVRGTVQADILKEDQGQNTCIFSTEFALRMMGDIQQYFIDHGVRNYYSVSISGYHIAEAGANPISQLAFTLSNAFTYVEYYLSRGMKIDDFAPNLSFFFSNGMDPEYTVMGRVARRIWSVAMKFLYKGNDRSQKLKYHIQTSGRSLHAQEIDFNDIRTTLQALLAIYDNCNSLHTNAYDEAITTPTEHSVRRAMAIQMIINREFGLTKNENPIQGAYIIEELTDLVEQAVLDEFMRIHERGGVLGAMETQYQRGKIQEESLYYETLKHSGELPIIGVNTFIDPETLKDDYQAPEIELARATRAEKEQQIQSLHAFQERHREEAKAALERLKQVAVERGNIFAELMETVKVASLGQITAALYEVGGQYRRNM